MLMLRLVTFDFGIEKVTTENLKVCISLKGSRWIFLQLNTLNHLGNCFWPRLATRDGVGGVSVLITLCWSCYEEEGDIQASIF